MINKEKLHSLIDVWRSIINDNTKSWILFEHGTCIVIQESQEDIEAQALKILEEWGPVVAGTPLGDFNVYNLDNLPGWIVVYPNPDIANYVDEDILRENDLEDQIGMHMGIGLFGRHLRKEDAASPKIIHIEDNKAKKK